MAGGSTNSVGGKLGRNLHKLFSLTVLILLSCIFILPFLVMLGDSLKDLLEYYRTPRVWMPETFRWRNYVAVFEVVPFARFIFNSICVTAIALTGQVLSACLVGYSFGRLRWPLRDLCFIILLSTLMLPHEVTMIPVYLLFKSLGWLDTWRPLYAPAWFGVNVFNVFLMRQFFKTVPFSLEEAAIIDGCSYFRILTTIMIPMAKPAVVSISILGFIHWWNDFFGPLIYLTDPNKFTIALGIHMFQSSQGSLNPHLVMAASTISVLPVIMIFFMAQKHFVKGMQLSGTTG